MLLKNGRSGGGGLSHSAARDRPKTTAEQFPNLTADHRGLLDVENGVLGTRTGNDLPS